MHLLGGGELHLARNARVRTSKFEQTDGIGNRSALEECEGTVVFEGTEKGGIFAPIRVGRYPPFDGFIQTVLQQDLAHGFQRSRPTQHLASWSSGQRAPSASRAEVGLEMCRRSGHGWAGRSFPVTDPNPTRSPSRSAHPRMLSVSPSARNVRITPPPKSSGRVPLQLSSSSEP